MWRKWTLKLCLSKEYAWRTWTSKEERKKKKKKTTEQEEIEDPAGSEDEGEDPALDSLSQAIACQQAKVEEQNKWKPSAGGPSTSEDSRRPRIKKSAYFSDEEELSD